MQATANINFKSFGAKGFATGAARKALGQQDVTEYVTQVDGKWGFWQTENGCAITEGYRQNMLAEVQAKATQAEAVAEAKATALQLPTLGTPRNTALSPFAAMAAKAAAKAAAAAQAEAEPETQPEPEGDCIGVEAMGNNPFGAMVAQCIADRQTSAARSEGTGATGRTCKVEKDRPEQNGIKRPSAGGMCRAVWDWCDSVRAAQQTPPAAKQVRAQAEAVNWNMNNALIEFYQWRKFNGITGRTAPAPAPAPAATVEA